jgi:hypothetical protein
VNFIVGLVRTGPTVKFINLRRYKMKIKVVVKGQIILVETNPYKRVVEQEAMNQEQFDRHMEAVEHLTVTEPGWSGRTYEEQTSNVER